MHVQSPPACTSYQRKPSKHSFLPRLHIKRNDIYMWHFETRVALCREWGPGLCSTIPYNVRAWALSRIILPVLPHANIPRQNLCPKAGMQSSGQAMPGITVTGPHSPLFATAWDFPCICQTQQPLTQHHVSNGSGAESTE